MTNKYYVISAIDEKGGIGRNGVIPWYYKEDFEWFKSKTTGGTCFMGRKTYAEIAEMRVGKKELLPGRKCVVFTRSELSDERVEVCNDMTRYVDFGSERNYFIGGVEVFKFALPFVDGAFITRIPGDYECDTVFPVETLERELEIIRTDRITAELTVDVYIPKNTKWVE